MQLQITYKEILKLSLPLMLSSLFNNVINLVGVAFMGRVGETELAAAGIAALIFITLTMIPYGFSVGFQIIIARRAGENDSRAIGNIFNSNIIFMFGISAVMFLFLKFMVPELLRPIFSSQEVYEAGMIYLNYRSWEILFAVFAFALIAFYTSVGNNQIITWSALMMLVVNIFFNYSLVFGKFGFEAHGIAGAGMASLISSSAATIMNIVYLFFSKYRRLFGLFNFKGVQWKYVKDGLRLSGPIVIQHLLSTGTWVMFFLLIENMGQDALAASNVAKEVYMVLGVSTWGFANATNSLVSNVLGQGRQDELFVLINKVLKISIGFSLIFLVVILSYPQMFIRIFTTDEELVKLASNPVRITGVCLLMMAVSSVLFRAVTGTGATKYSLLLEVVTIVIYVIYVIVLIPILHVNLTIAWTSEFVYWFTLAALCYWYLKSGKWKKIAV